MSQLESTRKGITTLEIVRVEILSKGALALFRKQRVTQ